MIETPDEKRERIRNGLEEIRLLKLKEFSTDEIINELCSRDVEVYTIGDKCEYCITADYGEDVCVCAYGPCKILVVKNE